MEDTDRVKRWKNIGTELLKMPPKSLKSWVISDNYLNTISAGFYKYYLEEYGLKPEEDFIISLPTEEEKKDKSTINVDLLRCQFSYKSLNYLFEIYRIAEIFNRGLAGGKTREANRMMDQIWKGMKELYACSRNNSKKPKKHYIKTEQYGKIDVAFLHGHELKDTYRYGFYINSKVDLCIFGHYHRLYAGRIHDMIFIVNGHLKKQYNPELLPGLGWATFDIINKEKIKVYLHRATEECIEKSRKYLNY